MFWRPPLLVAELFRQLAQPHVEVGIVNEIVRHGTLSSKPASELGAPATRGLAR
jgi:hypothetical protein